MLGKRATKIHACCIHACCIQALTLRYAMCFLFLDHDTLMLGKCSHDGCFWRGLKANFNKHKDGAWEGDRRRAGKHEGCPCGCYFVPDDPPASVPKLSSLQRTLKLLPSFDSTTMHEHMRGEFHRRAQISQRE